MWSRSSIGVAAAALAGLTWISIGGNAPPAPVSRPASVTDDDARVPTRATPAGAPASRSTGLPARDRSSSAIARSAPPITRGGGSSTPARAGSPSIDRAATPSSIIARETPQPGSPTTASTESAPPEDTERPKSRGIAGLVLEKTGAPAAGVPVVLKLKRAFNSSSSAASTAKTVSDDRGSFAFGEVADGEYEVRTEKNQRYESGVTMVRAGTTSAVVLVERISENAVTIHGVVESNSGGPLAAVRVDVIGQPSITTDTDARGAYRLQVPAGSRVEQTALRFRLVGYRDRRWAMSEGQRASDYEVIGNVRLDKVAPGLTINGVVTSTEGQPVANARVQLDSAALSRGYRAVSDPNGAFTLVNVETGADYRLWVRADSGFQDGVVEPVSIDVGAAPLSIQLKPAGRATLTGRMVSANGSPVPQFTMWLTSAYGGGSRSTPVTSDAQGRFRAENLAEGPIAMQTRSTPSLSVSGITLPPGGADITVIVDVGAYRIDGRLVTSQGSPAGGARVLLEWSGSNGGVTSRSWRETITDADGGFTFSELGAGVHIVSATLVGTGSARVDYVVDASQAPLRITLPARRGTQ